MPDSLQVGTQINLYVASLTLHFILLITLLVLLFALPSSSHICGGILAYSYKVGVNVYCILDEWYFHTHLYPSLYSHTLHLSYPTLQFCVDGGRCDGAILCIVELCNWSVRCVVCVL